MRGPDERELAFAAETRALLALYAQERKLEHLFDELIRAQAKVQAQGEQPRRPQLDLLRASWQVRRGRGLLGQGTIGADPRRDRQRAVSWLVSGALAVLAIVLIWALFRGSDDR